MVAPLVAAAGISAASSLLGGLLGGKDDVKHDSAHGETEGAIRAQMEAAEKYGISKQAMIGAPLVGGQSTVVGGGSPLGQAIAQGGADISRAVLQTGNNSEKMNALALENAQLNNDLLRASIAGKVKENFRNPPFPNGRVNNDAFIPIPDRSGGKLGVKHPGLAQQAEDNYGEIGGELFGGTALISDADAGFNQWMINTFGIDPRNYTPFAVGARHGGAQGRSPYADAYDFYMP